MASTVKGQSANARGTRTCMRIGWGTVVATVVLVACGGAAPESRAPAGSAASPPPMAPATPADQREREEAEPRTIDEAQAQIDRARAALDPTQPAPEKTPAGPPKPATSPSKSEPRAGATAGPTDERPASPTATESPCASSCRALSSMRRAVEALCRMTGETDKRCVAAKKTLSGSTERVVSCQCGS